MRQMALTYPWVDYARERDWSRYGRLWQFRGSGFRVQGSGFRVLGFRV